MTLEEAREMDPYNQLQAQKARYEARIAALESDAKFAAARLRRLESIVHAAAREDANLSSAVDANTPRAPLAADEP